jgi:hypothetical protein
LVDHGPGSRNRYSVYLDGLRIIRTPVPSLALSYLVWHINRSAVRESPRYLLIHASCAALDGRAVVMPAGMESGKTTLVAGLVRRGLDYVTDEVVAIDPATGILHPYPRPLSVDLGSWHVLADLEPPVPDGAGSYLAGQWHIAPKAIRPGAVATTCEVALVVNPRYVPTSETLLVALTKAEGLLMLAENSFNFALHGGAGLHALARVVENCACYRLTSSSLDEACDVVLALLGGAAA